MVKATLEQWRMLQAVVRHGGFAQAAREIHKSQSSINHAVHKLEDLLGLKLLEVRGRKAYLTEEGKLLLRRAGQLLDQAGQLQDIARGLVAGVETEVRIAVDEVYPYECLTAALQALSESYPNTRVQLMETVLSGGSEALLNGQADLLISGDIPRGYLAEEIMRVEFIAIANPDHPLHQLGRTLNQQDLLAHRQIVVRDSASGEKTDAGWLRAEQRWTVSHLQTSVDMVSRGLGFAWLPGSHTGKAISTDRLKALPLDRGARRSSSLYLTYANSDRAGPATTHLADLLLREARAAQRI